MTRRLPDQTDALHRFFEVCFGDATLPEKLAADVYGDELDRAIRTATGPIDTDVVRDRAKRRLHAMTEKLIEAELADLEDDDEEPPAP